MVLSPKEGSIRELFHLDLETMPNYPPPRVLATAEGIGVGNFAAWAFFAPKSKAEESGTKREEKKSE